MPGMTRSGTLNYEISRREVLPRTGTGPGLHQSMRPCPQCHNWLWVSRVYRKYFCYVCDYREDLDLQRLRKLGLDYPTPRAWDIA